MPCRYWRTTLLETRGIKRVPVVKQGRVVRIVGRSDLVQALAIRARLLAELERQSWWRRQIVTNVVVTDGVVHYWGPLDSEGQGQAAWRELPASV